MNDEDLAKTEPHPGARQEHREGSVARSIEQQTAKLPSDLFLWAAFASIGGSLALKVTGKDHAALFVGQWAPTFLLSGSVQQVSQVARVRRGLSSPIRHPILPCHKDP